jgi:hypothetical protein|tara:strand:- start:2934 stop:3128 length:195 start_codon:yes stop_codon:yes gene_type:complete
MSLRSDGINDGTLSDAIGGRKKGSDRVPRGSAGASIFLHLQVVRLVLRAEELFNVLTLVVVSES